MICPIWKRGDHRAAGERPIWLPIMSGPFDAIAGVPVVELARRFGTPTFVYDAAVIRRKIADLSAFDVVRLPRKPCSNLAILDLVRRARAGRCRQRRRNPPR